METFGQSTSCVHFMHWNLDKQRTYVIPSPPTLQQASRLKLVTFKIPVLICPTLWNVGCVCVCVCVCVCEVSSSAFSESSLYYSSSSTEHSPVEASNRSSGQEIPRLLWKPMFHYHVHKTPSLDPILSQLNLVHTLTTCLLMINFKLPSHRRLGLPSGLFPTVFRPKFCMHFSALPFLLNDSPISFFSSPWSSRPSVYVPPTG
jgi:hypothetical protein